MKETRSDIALLKLKVSHDEDVEESQLSSLEAINKTLGTFEFSYLKSFTPCVY
jgi:hypothetical protein